MGYDHTIDYFVSRCSLIGLLDFLTHAQKLPDLYSRTLGNKIQDFHVGKHNYISPLSPVKGNR